MRKLLLLPLVVLVVNAAAFSYAVWGTYAQRMQNPYGTRVPPPDVWGEYAGYVSGWGRLDFGILPVSTEPGLAGVVLQDLAHSVILAGAAFLLATGVGLSLGVAGARFQPPGVAPWLTALTGLGLALPGFYIGVLIFTALISTAMSGTSLVPIGGFGLDTRLLLPAIALGLRPMMQIASVTARLLAGEAEQPYVVTARSVGNPWRRVRWRHVLRNALSGIVLTIAATARFSLVELTLIETLFRWPGVGLRLAQTLVAPTIGNVGGPQFEAYFLYPPLVAALAVLFAVAFLMTDVLASLIVRQLDPRLRAAA
jgi:ABC-type dipeptide/oligopeptide/nickel transport system permease component